MFKSTFSQNSCEQLVLQKVDTCMIKCHFVFLINFKMKFYFYLNMENEIQIIYFNPCTKSIIPDFRAKQILKMKMKNEKLLKFVLFLNRIILLVHGLIRVPKYNLFFDLKTKQILKIFHFSFFNFITWIRKWKDVLKFMNSKIPIFVFWNWF